MSHGCHNRPPFKDWHHAQDGYHRMSKPEAGTRLPRIVQIPHVMSRDCKYSQLNRTDDRCEGCVNKHKDSNEYK